MCVFLCVCVFFFSFACVSDILHLCLVDCYNYHKSSNHCRGHELTRRFADPSTLLFLEHEASSVRAGVSADVDDVLTLVFSWRCQVSLLTAHFYDSHIHLILLQ
jgi:hypothetical protein